MAGNTIKEFLVALGFQVDENSYSKFESRIGKATAGAVELGEVVIATAISVETAVAKMARNFEELYYAGQRTQSSIRAMQGFEYAARTVGVASGSATGAVEGLARAMRSNPGISALLNNLGVRTQGRGAVDILGDTIGKLRQMPFYLAQQYGQMLGIDGDTLKMLIDRYAELRAAQIDYEKRQRGAGVNAQKLGEDSRKFMNALRSLEATLSLIGDRILQNFVDPATRAIKTIDEWAQSFIRLDVATDGWATALSTIGTTALTVWIAKLGLARLLFRSAAAEAAAVAAGGTAGAAGAAGAGAAAPAAAAAAAGWRLSLRGGSMGAMLGALGFMNYDDAHGNKGRSWLRRKLGISDDTADDTTGNGRKTVEFFRQQGWTREQAIGIATNFGRESAFRTNAVGDNGRSGGIGQWNGQRRDAFRKMFGHDVTQGTLEEQLKFAQYELTQGAEQFAGAMIRKAGSAAEAAAATSKFYERPRDEVGEMNVRGGMAAEWDKAYLKNRDSASGEVKVTNNNHFDIKSTEPKEVAREVRSGQGEVDASTVRYLAPTVR